MRLCGPLLRIWADVGAAPGHGEDNAFLAQDLDEAEDYVVADAVLLLELLDGRQGTCAPLAPGDPRQDQVGHPRRHWFMELKGLDDAIAFRVARLAPSCADCDEADDLCDDHYCDLNLISGYRQRVASLNRQKALG
jgi:hypothetical protein